MREEQGGIEKRGRGAWERGGAAVWAPAKKREKEERVGERYLSPLILELKD